ncbi:hypothetical protein PR048_018230 [Dryococelus australis]|uniref:Uncharacterized protein n=1 Tax=Dryococelus australis TaxID=614101 RepID=A0ABQ9HBW0_9NEOP|nr:hypothetical protein PR048_018230 [Dryococelus australis]
MCVFQIKICTIKWIYLPYLELCGASTKTRNKINLTISQSILWPGSTIVLAWFTAPCTKWNTLMAIIMSEIQDSSSLAEWRHILKTEPCRYNFARSLSRSAYRNLFVVTWSIMVF